jgi:flagellar biogenesis protein FliO
MRSSHQLITHSIRQAAQAVLSWIAALVVAAPAFGQVMSAPADSRYYTPPVADAPNETAPGEPLLSYRREDLTTSEPSAAPADPATRFAPAPPVNGDDNPLRKSPEPQYGVPLTALPDAIAAAPATEPAAAELPMAPPLTAETNAASSPPAAGIVNPFPDAAPPASAAQPAAEAPQQLEPPPVEPLIRYDASVSPAAHDEVATATPEPAAASLLGLSPDTDAATRRLAPPTVSSAEVTSDLKESKSTSLPFAFTKLESFSTAGAGLAIVVALFLVCVWMLRRGGAKTSGVLPADAFMVLGRAPLTAQSFAHLLRLGNKLVLVAMSPDGIQPLTEVTDPMEVDRLTGLCASTRSHGPSAEFQQVLAQLSREPARGFLGSEAKEGRRR